MANAGENTAGDGDGGAHTIPAALILAAQRFPDHEAVVDGPVRLTFTELYERVRECARFYLAAGVAPGDRVAICSPNTQHWVVAALGALHAGATLVPINTRFTGAEMLDVVERSQARVVVVAGPFLDVDRLAELRAAGLPASQVVLRIPVAGTPEPAPDVVEWDQLAERGAGVALSEVDTRAAAVRPGDVSDILFTSGTTGRSKGAMSTHAAALGMARAWADRGELTDSDRYLVVNPFFHSFGYKAGILATLVRGATLVPETTFDPERAMALIDRERITVLPGVPTIYRVLLDHPQRREHDLSTLRLAVTGAATVPVALVERMQTELSFRTVLTAYGLTEAPVATMCRSSDDDTTVATTCGRAAAGFELRLDAESGEILLRGPNLMLGYLDDPDATAAAIDADGWLHTGDVGTLDDRGYLRITDRIKDMYICGGFNVYPAEVEQVLARLPGVAESAVLGVPDDRLGEVGLAVIVGGPQGPPSEDEVLGHAKRFLANYKVPRRVEFRTELPRNASGKVLKRVLREEKERP